MPTLGNQEGQTDCSEQRPTWGTHAFLEGVLQGSHHQVFSMDVLLLHELWVTVTNAASAQVHGGMRLCDSSCNLLQFLLDAVVQIVGGDDGSFGATVAVKQCPVVTSQKLQWGRGGAQGLERSYRWQACSQGIAARVLPGFSTSATLPCCQLIPCTAQTHVLLCQIHHLSSERLDSQPPPSH